MHTIHTNHKNDVLVPVLKSPLFMQMFMSDDARTSMAVMVTIQSMLRIEPYVLYLKSVLPLKFIEAYLQFVFTFQSFQSWLLCTTSCCNFRKAMRALDQKLYQQIIDELIFKLSSASILDVAK